MTIWEIVEQGFRFAVTCRWLWLFGFFVGIWSGGSGSGGGGGNSVAAGAAAGGAHTLGDALVPAGLVEVPFTVIAVVVAGVTLGLLLLLLRFVGEGALIEGVVRARQGGSMSTREGLRAGWAHWGVLLRIALLYVAATIVSVAVPVGAVVAVVRALGGVAGAVFALPLATLVVPWLVTLYLVQAFAMRIAVLEDRGALDALAKARLFLHGRISLGLKLLVAAFVGTLIFGVVAALTIVPVALSLLALLRVLPWVAVVALGCLVLLPIVCVLTAMLGTYRSSIWTIGYVSEGQA